MNGRLFIDQKHRDFYMAKCRELNTDGDCLDSYTESLLYLFALCDDTRRHFSDLFDIKERTIKHEGLHKGWQTGTSRKLTRLAFNLWNGCASDSKDYAPSETVGLYAPDEIFCCGFQQYFFEAIRLRFPEYAHT